MKRSLSILLIFFIITSMIGCTTLQKKFTRKKKGEKKAPKIYQVRKYEKRPTPELYTKHFNYWSSWQSELIKVIGSNRKKDKICAEEIVGNLKDMHAMLVKEKADILKTHLDKLIQVRDAVVNEEMGQSNKDSIRRTLEREERFIKKEFVPKKVKNYLRESFEEELPAAPDSEVNE